MKLSKLAYSLIIFIGIIVILFIGKDLILPLAIAIMIFYVIKEQKKWLSKISVNGRNMPNWLLSLVAFSSIVLSLFIFGNILYNNIQLITDVIPTYQENINNLVSKFINFENVDLTMATKEWINGDKISSFIQVAVESISGILSNSFLILLYLIFLMLESSKFSEKVKLIYFNNGNYENIRFIIDNVNDSMSRYITLKTITSLSTGILSYVVLLLLEIDFAFFWAFLIFVLNYIPTIGSLIATLFPALIALLQFGTLLNPTIVLVSIGTIQFFVGNVLEPKLMGNTLNVSPLVVLLSLAFWGTIWGVTGMILSVPITIMVIISFSQFEATKWISILLSENGDILENKRI
jgi:predicted PurR-regulated permease PerM